MSPQCNLPCSLQINWHLFSSLLARDPFIHRMVSQVHVSHRNDICHVYDHAYYQSVIYTYTKIMYALHYFML